jgi:glyoxylase I family protein
MFRSHHVALSVSDLERSIEFYHLFGFALQHTYASTDGDRLIAHLRLGDMLLELFCYRNPSTASQCTNDWKADLATVGSKHVGLSVVSLREARERLEAAGCVCSTPTHGLTGMDYFFVRDPDGIWMEIVQDDRPHG